MQKGVTVSIALTCALASLVMDANSRVPVCKSATAAMQEMVIKGRDWISGTFSIFGGSDATSFTSSFIGTNVLLLAKTFQHEDARVINPSNVFAVEEPWTRVSRCAISRFPKHPSLFPVTIPVFAGIRSFRISKAIRKHSFQLTTGVFLESFLNQADKSVAQPTSEIQAQIVTLSTQPNT